ncbi:MAG: molybdopterin-binding/glycosyltransferase family 2 protein [Pseudomonadota bacterium]
MKFGPTATGLAEGAILAHSTRCGDRTLKKGLVLSGDDIAALRAAGVDNVIVAQLGPDDVHEDDAAQRAAAAMAGPGIDTAAPFTGRVNLIAKEAGVVVLDSARIEELNSLDESLTVATLPAFAMAEAGQMVATIKVIPFAAPRDGVAAWEAIATRDDPVIRLASFKQQRIGLILTMTDATPDKVLDKTARVVADRLAALGSDVVAEGRCHHNADALASEIARVTPGVDMTLIYGASAITDRRDVIPAAIEQADGAIQHFGMPVDPGNLLLLAERQGKPVLGLPGCARSPKLNGFDWVLQRMLAGLAVTRNDIMAMGVGGLLKEIPSRPQPRREPQEGRVPRVTALVLAAGQSRRMGRDNKLLAPINGRAMIRHVAEAAVASQAHATIVVTGHEAEAVGDALDGLDLTTTDNPDYAEGLSTSLRAGLEAAGDDCDGVIVCLGDMPGLTPALLNRLIAAFDPTEGRAIVLPTYRGKRGNPVLWGRRFFEAMRSVAGDVGARHLLGENEDLVVEVTADDDAVLVDIDTPEALQAARRG